MDEIHIISIEQFYFFSMCQHDLHLIEVCFVMNETGSEIE